MRRAEELKIRDKLVVVVQSEMGRTPTYNNGNGKDHWSIGSVMFLGRGIKGNRVIGATDEKQFHVPLDPQTLALRQGQGHPRPPRAHPHRACANSPASPTTPSARSSRSASRTKKSSLGCGADRSLAVGPSTGSRQAVTSRQLPAGLVKRVSPAGTSPPASLCQWRAVLAQMPAPEG